MLALGGQKFVQNFTDTISFLLTNGFILLRVIANLEKHFAC